MRSRFDRGITRTAARVLLCRLALLALSPAWLQAAKPAIAQTSEFVVVGVTPTCPYGIVACASGAREGLQRLENVRRVAQHPDQYNCTFDMLLERRELPDPEKWRRQFASVVGETFVFRGVEVTLTGTVTEAKGVLMLRVEEGQPTIELAPLEHKLQWNFRKESSREPEPAERDAWLRLAAALRTSAAPAFMVEVIGPLRYRGETPIVEVREFFLSKVP